MRRPPASLLPEQPGAPPAVALGFCAPVSRPFLRVVLLGLACLLSGCAALRQFDPYVELSEMPPDKYIALKRGDILTRGELSAATLEIIRVAGLAEGPCVQPALACIDALRDAEGINAERRLSAQSELWLSQAKRLQDESAGLAAWLEAARHAYAYLLFVERGPDERAFEDRQTQVRDWYNYAVQQVAQTLFDLRPMREPPSRGATLAVAGWTFSVEGPRQYRWPEGALLKDLVPAASLVFGGLRSVYRRDGLGAELVAVLTPQGGESPADAASADVLLSEAAPPWSEMPSPAMTVLLHFQGDDLDTVLRTRRVRLSVHDPYAERAVDIHGHHVPLAANFTAGYGLWLARSGFADQSLQTLLGRERGIRRPHVYMLQPYEPGRRIIVMLHGLASSPEAWVNLANEIQGDETLRERFQIWLVYYPTNLPVALNHFTIREVLQQTLAHFDPDARARASRDLVLIGHSMGGVISRLLVSFADEQLLETVIPEREDTDPERLQRVRTRFAPLLSFEPFPGVSRVIFIASPHRGSPVAGQRLARWLAQMIRLPVTVMESFASALKDLDAGDRQGAQREWRLPTSIENLDEKDAFMRAAADLPISTRVRYHSIIAQSDPALSLLDSDDGLVPYRSAHLPGAASEKIIVSGHSVQQNAAAIIEIRRILHEDIAASRGQAAR